MALYRLSRFRFCFALEDSSDKLYLVEREPFRFREENDNRSHIVQEGDTIFNLAGRYFRGMDANRACGLWWVIADFNGLHDPTLALAPGSEIIIPSTRLVRMEVFNSDRRREI